MATDRPKRINVMLDDAHAAKLHDMAERMYVQPGTIAKSLLSTALDGMDVEAASISALLDAIPGAWDRTQQGVADAAAGRILPLDQL